MITEKIENSIKLLKEKRYIEDKKRQYGLIASSFNTYFKQTNTLKFKRSLIMSFFEADFFKPTTQQRHIKNILSTMKEKGIIANDKINTICRQRRIYSLASNDEKSYTTMMKKNGYSVVDYYKWYCDSDGIPQKKRVAKSRINCLPVYFAVDENGDSVDDYDFSQLRETIPREKQGVKGLVSLSVAVEKRQYKTNCFIVL